MDRKLRWEYRGLGKRPKVGSSASNLAQEARTSLEVLGLSVRAYNCLHREGVHTVEQLARLGDLELLDIRTLGQNTLAEIKQKLAAYLESHPQLQARLAAEVPSEQPQPERAGQEQSWGIEVLGLSVRTRRKLKLAGIDTVAKALTFSDSQLLDIEGVGMATVMQLRRKLDAYTAGHRDSRKSRGDDASRSLPKRQEGPVNETRTINSTPIIKSGVSTLSASELAQTPLQALGLSSRVYHLLRQNNIDTIGQLAELSDWQILKIRNLGGMALGEIRKRLSLYEGVPLETRISEEALGTKPPYQRRQRREEMGSDQGADPPIEVLRLSHGAQRRLKQAGVHTVLQAHLLSDSFPFVS